MTKGRSNINLEYLAATETKLIESQEKKPVKIGIHKTTKEYSGTHTIFKYKMSIEELKIRNITAKNRSIDLEVQRENEIS